MRYLLSLMFFVVGLATMALHGEVNQLHLLWTFMGGLGVGILEDIRATIAESSSRVPGGDEDIDEVPTILLG